MAAPPDRFESGCTIVNDYARKADFSRIKANFSGDDTREGMTAIVSIKHPDPNLNPNQSETDERGSADNGRAGCR